MRGSGVQVPHSVPIGRSIALVDNYEDGYGDGPDGSELGGHHATVEAARSVHLIFIKKYDIIYIQ